MISPSNIKLDPETHIYTVNGNEKTSVTQMLKKVGIVDYTGLDPYYAERGTMVHDYCTLSAQGWLDFDTVREDCVNYVKTFERIVFELGLKYLSAEQLCYDEEYDICGQYDLIMEWDDKRTLVELKTGAAPMWLGLQCAAYERMIDVDDVIGISLKDGKVYVKDSDFLLNTVAWDDINTGFFNLEAWKGDRKRRRMRLLK